MDSSLSMYICIKKNEQKYEIVKYIYLGDLIDRGPWSKYVLRFVKSLMESTTPIVLLKGNHEDEFIKMLKVGTDYIDWHLWGLNGGKETLESFNAKSLPDLAAAFEEYMPLFDAMKDYHIESVEGKTFIFSHAGGDSETLNKILDGNKLTSCEIEDLMSSRKRYLEGGEGRDNTFYVYGHTPVHYASDRSGMDPLIIWNDSHTSADIDIDTGCYTGKALSALVIDAETGEFETVSIPYTEPPVNKDPRSDEYEEYYDWWLDECVKSAGEAVKKSGGKRKRESAAQEFIKMMTEEAEAEIKRKRHET